MMKAIKQFQKAQYFCKAQLLTRGPIQHIFTERAPGLLLIFYTSCLMFQSLLWVRQMVKSIVLGKVVFIKQSNLMLKLVVNSNDQTHK